MVSVRVRVMKIFGTKDNYFLTLSDATKNECSPSSGGGGGGAEILSIRI